MKDLAIELKISGSEVSESLNSSAQAGLISPGKKNLMYSAILDFPTVCQSYTPDD